MIVSLPNMKGQELDVSGYTIPALPKIIEGESSHEKLEWFLGSNTYLLATNVLKKGKLQTFLYFINNQRKTIIIKLPVPKNQSLQIDNLVQLENGLIFVQGFFYCNKKRQKRLKNWYAIVNEKAEIVQEKKTKYKKYQEAIDWESAEVALLYNPIKGGKYTNRPQVDFLDLKTLKVVKSISLEYPETHAFINNLIKIDTGTKELLVIGMQTPILPNVDSLTYAKNILCTFDKNGKYVKNLLAEDDKEYFEITDEPIAIEVNEHADAMIRVSTNLYSNGGVPNEPTVTKYNIRKGQKAHTPVAYYIEGIEHIYCGSGKEHLIIMGGYQGEEAKKYPYFTLYSSVAINYSTGIVGYDLMDMPFYYFNNKKEYKVLEEYVGDKAAYNGNIVLLKIIEESNERMLCKMVLLYSPINEKEEKVLIELDVEFAAVKEDSYEDKEKE